MTDKMQLPETLTIPLKKPVQLGDLTYHELKLREPTAGEMCEVQGKTGWEFNVAIIAAVSGVPDVAVRKIGVDDARKATKYLDGFFD